MTHRSRFSRAYQIDSCAHRGICVIIDFKNRMCLDCVHLQQLFTDLNFIVKVHTGLKGAEIKEEFDKYRLIDHTNFYCFVGIILSPATTTDDDGVSAVVQICGSDGEVVELDSLLKPFCLNDSLMEKPKVFLVQKDVIRPSTQTIDSMEKPKHQPNNDGPNNEFSFSTDMTNVLVCCVTSDYQKNLQTSFFREYEQITRGKANVTPLTAILKEAKEKYETHLKLSGALTGNEFNVFDTLTHDLFLPLKGFPVVQRQNRDDPVFDPNSVYPMNSTIKGYCLIINNLGSEFESDCRYIEELFQNELGFYSQTFTDLSTIAIEELLMALSSVNHTVHDGLVFAMFAEGNETDLEVVGCDKKKLSIAQIEGFFSYDNCPTLSSKPKLFIYNLQCARARLPSASKFFHYDGLRNTNTLPDCFRIVCTYDELNKNMEHRFSFAFVKAVRKTSAKTNTLDFISASTRVEHELLRPDIGRQLKLHLIEDRYADQQQKIRAAEFKLAFNLWIRVRKKVIVQLRQKAEDLLKVAKNSRIARAVGAGVGLAGGAMAVAGFVLIPFTLGGSVLFSVAGAGMAAAGGATSVGAGIVGKVIENSGLKEVDQLLNVERQLGQIMQELLKMLQEEAENLVKKNPGTSSEDWLFGILRSGETVLRVGSVGVKGVVIGAQLAGAGGLGVLEGGVIAARVATGAAVGVAAVGGVLNVLLLPISIIDLGVNVHALATDKKTSAINELYRIIDELEKNMNNTEDYINGNVSTND